MIRISSWWCLISTSCVPLTDNGPFPSSHHLAAVYNPHHPSAFSDPHCPKHSRSQQMPAQRSAPRHLQLPPRLDTSDQMTSAPLNAKVTTKVPSLTQTEAQPVVTRSGRVVKPNPRYADT
ncbi:hypothetical protein ACOMHN_000657 [Nucella lapillus]